MIKTRRTHESRVCQGDVIRDVEHIEYYSETPEHVEVSKIVFPRVLVLTQDCDLAQDYRVRWSRETTQNQDKMLFSVLVAPLYVEEHIYTGEHLSELDMAMQIINKNRTPGASLRNNETARYHRILFPEGNQIPASVVDFKHYFSVNVSYLKKLKRSNFLCKIGDLYREDVSQRFAAFLSRIGLPDPPKQKAAVPGPAV